MNFNFKSLIRLPKIQVAGFLFVFFCLGESIIGWQSALRLLVTSIGFTVLFDLGFIYFRIRKLLLPSAAIVSGLILTLIIDPSVSWFQIAVITAAAMGMKHFGRISGRHVFNPAAFGLFIGWVFFRINPSWWAATALSGDKELLLNIMLYAALFGIGYISCFKLRRYPAAVSYLISALIFSFLISSTLLASVQTIFSLGVLFFTLVMLVEPMTSPTRKERQIAYGVFVALTQILIVFGSTKIGFENLWSDASITALLLGNLVFFKFR